MNKFLSITSKLIKLSEIKSFRYFVFVTSFFFLVANGAKSQVTIITNTVTWTTGWCNICGPLTGNYACAQGSGSPMWNSGINNFVAPAIPGQVVTGVCITVNKVDCGLTNLCVTMNGVNIQCIPTPPGTNCSCGACWPQTFCNNFPCPTGIPGFNYGGVNQIQLINTGNLCVNNAVITLTYQTCCQAPTITAVANPIAVCAGFPSTLTAGGAGIGGTYTWQPGGLIGASVVVSPAVTTIYTVSGTTSLSCTGTRTVQVTVNPTPTITATPNPTAICIGQSATVTLAGANTYTTNVGNLIGTPIVVSPTATTIYTTTGTSALGCVGTVTFQIIVNPLPVVLPGSNSPVCAGGNLSLTVGPATTYTWTGPGAFVSNLQNPVRTNATPTMSGVYTVSVTNGSGCTASATINVVVSPPLVVNPTNTGPYCAGANISLSVTAGTTYSWTGPAGFVNNLQMPVIVNGQTINAGVYTVSVTLGGCISTGTTNVVVNPLPSPTAAANSPVCVGQPINFNGSGGTTYTWTGPGGFASNAQNPLIAVAQVSNAGVYTLNVSNAFGCTKNTTVNVVVNPLPVIVVNSPTVCVGQPINLTATGGTAYAWSGPLGYVSAVQNPIIPNAQLTMSGGYTVIVTSAFGCTASAVANVSVITLPTPNIVSNSPVCVGGTLSFTASGAGAYNWSGPNGFVSLLINPSIVNVQLVASGIYTLIGTAGSCSNVTTASITINPLPTPTATSNSPVCVGQPINFTGAGGTTYTWSGPGGFASNAQNPLIGVAQASNAGVYTLNVSNAFGCTKNTTVNVVINPLPIIAVNSPTVCLNTPINLTANGGTAYAWSGPLGYVSPLQNPIIPNAQLNMSGNYTVTVTSNFGCTNTAVANVLVLTLPVPNIVSNSPVCVGGTLSFTASGAGTYNWTGPNGFASALVNPSIVNVQLVAGGIYTLVGTAGTCSASTTASITINPLPVPTATSNSAVCLNQALNLMGGGGTSYAWAGPGGYSALIQNPVISVAQNSNAGVYTLTVTNANGCTNTITTNVVINPLPIVVALGSTVCLNTTVFLSSGGANTYAWTGPNAFVSGTQNPTILNGQAVMTGPYTVIGTSALGCTNSAVANVVVLPLPSPTITSNSPICIGAGLNLNGTGGVSYSWTGPNGFASNAQNPNIPNTSMAANGTYSLVATVGTCTNVTTALIVINPLPTPSITSNNPVCLLKPVNFFANGGTTFVWVGPNGFTANGANVNIPSATNIHNGTYSITVTDANNCTKTVTTSVLVNPLPVISAVGSTICAAKTISLSASGGTAYAWAGPAGFVSASPSDIIPNSTQAMQGNYSVTVTDLNGCVSTSLTNVKINPLPTPTANANSPICTNQTINLTAGDATATSYIWTGPNGFISTLRNPVLADALPNSSGMYTVTVSDNIGCTAQVMVSMIVNKLPEVNIVPDKNHGCVPVCITFSPQSTSSIQTSFWEFGDGTNAAGNVVTKCFKYAGNYDIKSRFTDVNGCSNTGTFTIGTDPIPVADFNYESSKPIINETVEFIDASYGANIVGWSWNFSHLKNQVIPKQNTTLSFVDAGTYAVALVVISNNGCRDTIVKSIVVGEDFGIYVPDAFSPNDDGLNDIFQPKGYGVVKYELNIFDRWGERMFGTQDFNSGWDGTYFARPGNETVKEDVYIWSIKLTSVFGKTKEISGKVTVVK